MFRLKLEIDIPTGDHTTARQIQERFDLEIERGFGFKCYSSLYNIGVDPGVQHIHPPMGFSAGNLGGSHSHRRQAHVVHEFIQPEFTEEEKRNFLKAIQDFGLLPEPPEPEFIKEKDMKI